MLSRLYECRIWHARLQPRAHRFAYRVFYLALDLDELPVLSRRLRWLGLDRPGVLSWYQADYLPAHFPLHNPSRPNASGVAPTTPGIGSGGLPPLKTRVLAYLAARGIEAGPECRVLLLTLPRVLGYQFNPVSFYFVSTAEGRPIASIAEVTNTFRETKPFVLGPDTLPAPLPEGCAEAAPVFHARAPKHFYVSPYSAVDDIFDFRLSPPGAALELHIDDYVGEQCTLRSCAHQPRPASAAYRWGFGVVFPKIPVGHGK